VQSIREHQSVVKLATREYVSKVGSLDGFFSADLDNGGAYYIKSVELVQKNLCFIVTMTPNFIGKSTRIKSRELF
jgi:hypothetical protein